jgi:hypothetical protein
MKMNAVEVNPADNFIHGVYENQVVLFHAIIQVRFVDTESTNAAEMFKSSMIFRSFTSCNIYISK